MARKHERLGRLLGGIDDERLRYLAVYSQKRLRGEWGEYSGYRHLPQEEVIRSPIYEPDELKELYGWWGVYRHPHPGDY